MALLGVQYRHDPSVPTRKFTRATYRWFTDPGERERYLPEDHDHDGRMDVARPKALLETGAEVLGGLLRAFTDYAEGTETAWQR